VDDSTVIPRAVTVTVQTVEQCGKSKDNKTGLLLGEQQFLHNPQPLLPLLTKSLSFYNYNKRYLPLGK